jgi:transcriptional regulator with XRE-family HTH domain
MKYDIPTRVKNRLKTLGKLINAARRARGFTQKQLAERASASERTIIRLESGNAKIAWGTVMTVCWLLDIPTDPELIDPVRRAELLATAENVQRARGMQEMQDDF